MANETLNWLIDHRPDLPPVGNQGSRPTCLSWSVTCAHNHRVIDQLSVEYLHHRSKSYKSGAGTISGVSAALSLDGQPPEDQWPYQPYVDDAEVLHVPDEVAGPFSRAALRTCKIESVSILDELELGSLVIAGLFINRGFMRPSDGVILDNSPGVNGHAVAVVGAAEYLGPSVVGLDTNDVLFCIRNSWGTGWGRDGHALVTPRAFRSLLREALILESA